MTPERWQQIDQLFHAALAHEPAKRAGFIAEACAGDEPLRAELESLISSHQEAQSFIEDPASDVAAELLGWDQSRLEAGQQLGSYQILRLLGTGGMGEVYLAEDNRLGRQIALKLLPPQYLLDAGRVVRFEQEARAASALNHPNIVTIHEIGQTDDSHFIATEFIDGQTLRQRLAQASLTLMELLEIASQVASALAVAHAAGIVHRDIKPDNIMLRRDGLVKVLDFGLAKLNSRNDPEAVGEAFLSLVNTNAGMVMGTVNYMSPEQARGEEVDHRTDIWSLGVVLYEMVTGAVPSKGENPREVIGSILESEEPALPQPSEVPAQLARIITRALRKERDERYATAVELADDVKRLKHEVEVQAHLTGADFGEVLQTTTAAHPTTPTSSAEYLVNKIKRHRRGVILAPVLIVLALATVYLFYFFRSSNLVAAGEAIDSIAVLPFDNVSGAQDAQYLSDGISDSIINSLYQLPNLKKVIALNSVLSYKGQQVDPQTVGRELNVRAVLMGRLTLHGDEVLIITELIDVQDKKRLWGGQYKRKLVDVLPLHGQIVQEISERLRLKLTGEQKERLAKSSTNNPEAYQLYLWGRFHRHKRENQKARDYLEQAIKKDPNYAPAYAQLAYTYHSATASNWISRKEAQEKKKWAVQRALELDDMLGDAHAALALTTDDRSVMTREFQRALELDPNSADVHAFYARMLWTHRLIDEAILHMKRAVELDPLSPALQTDLGKILYSAGQRDQAMEQYRKALDLNPNYFGAHHHLANYYLAERRYDEAIAEAEKMRANSTTRDSGRPFLGYTYAVAGKRAEAEKILHELKELSKQRHVNGDAFALIYTGLGDKDRAIEFLQKEYEENKRLPIFINILPEWDSLRTDPRFEELIRQSEWHR